MGQHSVRLSLGPETVGVPSDPLQGLPRACRDSDVKEFRFYAGERALRADGRQLENSSETAFEEIRALVCTNSMTLPRIGIGSGNRAYNL